MQRRSVYVRVLVLDGNFTAIHQHQPNAVDDVHLTAGEFFMAESTRYNCHVAVAQESKQVNSIYNMFNFLPGSQD